MVSIVSTVEARDDGATVDARSMRKELLHLRSLVARGRARERKARTRRTTPREVALLFAPTFPNELFWKVATYWNPRYEALTPNN